MKKIFFTTSALALTLMTGSAFAAEKASSQSNLEKQVQMLQDQLRAMQSQLDAVKANEQAQTDAIKKEADAREAAEKAAKEANLDAGGKNVFENGKVRMIPPSNPKVVESGSHSFTMTSADGNWSIQPTGRVHMDFGGYLKQSPEGTTGPGTAAGGKLSGGVNARRARFGVTGKAAGDFTYSIILEAGGTNDGAATFVAPASTTCTVLPCTITTPAVAVTSQLVNTAVIGYTGIKNTIIEAGYFAQYFTLDESTSSNNIMFLERASPVTVASSVNTGDPRFGAGFRTWESNWWVGAYMTASQPGAIKNLTNRGLGAFQRATYNPIQNDTESVHVGVGVAELFQVPTGNGPNTTTAASISLSDRPELRLDGTQFLNTGALGTVANPVTGVQIYNAEAAAAYGSFFTQAEYFHYVVNRRGKTDAEFDGAYAQASYTFGGRRTYTVNCGCYSGVTPITNFSPNKGGWGAFELAARYSYVNLTDQYSSGLASAAQPNFVNGGQQTNMTFGLNWYWNSNMMWKLNYIHSNYDKSTNPTAAKAGITIDALAARFQFMF